MDSIKSALHLWLITSLFVSGCVNITEPIMRGGKPKGDYVEDAISKKDWEQAYLLIEQALASKDLLERYAARHLVERFPDIKDGALESFSRENLARAYRINSDLAPLIQWQRLVVFKRTIATPEQYAQGLSNYEAIYGVEAVRNRLIENQKTLDHELISDIVDGKLAQELHDAVSEGRVVESGKVEDLLETLIPGKTRKDVLASIGNPSGRFELNSIMTWPLRIENESYKLLPGFIRNQDGVTHSLVLVFDKQHVLIERKLVKIVK